MDESALERFFDSYIANDSSEMEEGVEELTREEELCVSSLPDELLTLFESGRDNTDETRQTADNESRGGLHCTSQNYSSQNPTGAAELPGPLSLLGPGRSSAQATTPVIHLPDSPPKITNIMATVNLGCRLDLDLIAHKVWNVEYNPKRHRALVLRIRKPRTTALFYQTGRVVFTGAKSEEAARLGARRCARVVQKLGFPVSFLNFKIHNIVASWSTSPVSLARLAVAHPLVCSYEPELFSGLFYHLAPGFTFTICISGKIILSGAKKTAEIYKAFDTIAPILSCFRARGGRAKQTRTGAPVPKEINK